MNQKIKNLINNLPEDFDPKLEDETNDLEKIEQAKLEFDREQTRIIALEKIEQAKLEFDREQTRIIAEHGIAGIVEVGGMGRFEMLRRWFAKGFYSFNK